MSKRKTLNKRKAAEASKTAVRTEGGRSMPVPALLMKILAVVLAAIMLIALTLYVLDRIPARGFWTLTIILAVIAFVIMPVMRKKFLE
ncbi:hypothetical protein JW898_01685 [Candidatus Woesearchaeota archaeon]|nr:hypothetical protein [Candidatus Woesearchaeota archaeon]